MNKIRYKKWRRKDTILFLERLELYVSAGLTINRALSISTEGIPMRQKMAVQHALDMVEAGGLLSKALTESIGLSKTIAGLIEHGESSGELVRALGVAKSLMEREDELLKKCTSAMAYPVIIAVFASLLTIGLVRGVMPQIIPMLKSLHVQLPLLTRAVIFVSESFLKYGLYAAVLVAIASISVSILYKKVERFKSAVHAVILRIPLIGGLSFSYFLAVFLRSCGALLESGLSISRAYASTVRTISFIPLRDRLQAKTSAVSRGVPIATIFAFSHMPSYVAPLVNAGEVSGTLGTSMVRAAAILDREIEHSLKRLTSLIEPVMMAGMGMVVGSIALSIMMPIYDISRVLQQH
jgi:type II secretory pathway component PulF